MKVLKVLGAVLLGVWLVLLVFNSQRQRNLDELFRQALGYTPAGSEDTITAVRKLASYEGASSTSMLLEIALGDHPTVWPQTRAEAIVALGHRGDPRVATAMATHLQLHEPLATRKALASALRETKCEEDCIQAVLHYLERVFRGEATYDDRFVPPNMDFKQFIEREQAQVVEDLHRVLTKNPESTLLKLRDTYGLGSENPSSFGLNVIAQLDLRNACPTLLRSFEKMTSSPLPGYDPPLQEVRQAMGRLGCKPD